jgi:hypothetical protein
MLSIDLVRCGKGLITAALLSTGATAGAAITNVTVDQQSPGTVVTIDSFTGTTANFTISTPLSDPDTDLLGLFSFAAHFDTDGVVGSVLIAETITNTGSLAWHEWGEVAAGVFDGLVLSGPDDVSWSTTFSSTRAGTFELTELPGIFGFPDGTFSSAVLRFDTPLEPGQSFTLTKTVLYAAGSDTGGVQRIDIVNFPAAVPLPPAFAMFLFGMSALIGMMRIRRAG